MTEPKPSRENAGKVGKGKPPVEHQFKPGQSGNPAGTKGVSIVAALKRKLAQVDPKTGRELVDEFAEMVWAMALNGNERMACEIIRHVDGMPRQPVDLETPNGIQIEDAREAPELPARSDGLVNRLTASLAGMDGKPKNSNGNGAHE